MMRWVAPGLKERAQGFGVLLVLLLALHGFIDLVDKAFKLLGGVIF